MYFLIDFNYFNIDMVKDEDRSEQDANKYFYIMKMALDIRNNKMMVQVLSYLQVNILIMAVLIQIWLILLSTYPVNLYFTGILTTN